MSHTFVFIMSEHELEPGNSELIRVQQHNEKLEEIHRMLSDMEIDQKNEKEEGENLVANKQGESDGDATDDATDDDDDDDDGDDDVADDNPRPKKRSRIVGPLLERIYHDYRGKIIRTRWPRFLNQYAWEPRSSVWVCVKLDLGSGLGMALTAKFVVSHRFFQFLYEVNPTINIGAWAGSEEEKQFQRFKQLYRRHDDRLCTVDPDGTRTVGDDKGIFRLMFYGPHVEEVLQILDDMDTIQFCLRPMKFWLSMLYTMIGGGEEEEELPADQQPANAAKQVLQVKVSPQDWWIAFKTTARGVAPPDSTSDLYQEYCSLEYGMDLLGETTPMTLKELASHVEKEIAASHEDLKMEQQRLEGHYLGRPLVKYGLLEDFHGWTADWNPS